MEENILICEDSLEGVLTAVYTAYEKRYSPERTGIQISGEGNLRLFAVYEQVETDAEKSGKVLRTLRRRFGEEGCYTICQALASTQPEKATAVYRTIAKGLRLPSPESVLLRYADPDVAAVQKLKCNVWHEMHHLFGFLRFRELQSGILFSEISPKNNVTAYLAEHFSDRLPMEHFVICDCGRGLFAVHEAGKRWFLVRNADFDHNAVKESDGERMCQELFRHFCHKIAVEARENKTLQRGMLPLRFRPYMTEFDGK